MWRCGTHKEQSDTSVSVAVVACSRTFCSRKIYFSSWWWRTRRQSRDEPTNQSGVLLPYRHVQFGSIPVPGSTKKKHSCFVVTTGHFLVCFRLVSLLWKSVIPNSRIRWSRRVWIFSDDKSSCWKLHADPCDYFSMWSSWVSSKSYTHRVATYGTGDMLKGLVESLWPVPNSHLEVAGASRDTTLFFTMTTLQARRWPLVVIACAMWDLTLIPWWKLCVIQKQIENGSLRSLIPISVDLLTHLLALYIQFQDTKAIGCIGPEFWALTHSFVLGYRHLSIAAMLAGSTNNTKLLVLAIQFSWQMLVTMCSGYIAGVLESDPSFLIEFFFVQSLIGAKIEPHLNKLSAGIILVNEIASLVLSAHFVRVRYAVQWIVVSCTLSNQPCWYFLCQSFVDSCPDSQQRQNRWYSKAICVGVCSDRSNIG